MSAALANRPHITRFMSTTNMAQSTQQHMLLSTPIFSFEQSRILADGLGTFAHPSAKVARVLREVGHPDIPSEVMEFMSQHRPKICPDRWARIQAFVEDAVTLTAPQTTQPAKVLKLTAAHYVEWAHFDKGWPLDGKIIWSKKVIDLYVNDRYSHLSEGTRRNYRSYLDRISRVLSPEEHSYEYTPLNRKSSVSPYSGAEMIEFKRWAAFQSNPLKKDRAMMMLVFCAGAGLRAIEVGLLMHDDITDTGNGYVINVRGKYARQVPLLAEWESWLEVLLERRPEGQTLWGKPNRTNTTNLLSSFTQYTEGQPPRGDRLRNTWLVELLRRRVPMTDLFYAAGVSKMEHLGRLIKHIPPMEGSAYQAAFRGEVAR